MGLGKRDRAGGRSKTLPAPSLTSYLHAFMDTSETKPGSYDFPAFEQKWQAAWKAGATFRTEPISCGKPKYYVLDMFLSLIHI